MDSAATKKTAAERFGRNAAKYALSRVHADPSSLAELVRLVAPGPNDRLLDVATGSGNTALAFAPCVREVVATDLSQGMLEQTMKTAAERGLENVSPQIADAESLPFPEGSFDIVACRIAAHHFPDQPQFFREAVRVLKPGGKLAFVDNYAPGSPETRGQVEEIERLRDSTHVRTWTLDEIRSQIRDAGLRVIHESTGHAEASGQIDFDEWVARIETPQAEVAELRRRFLGADEGLRQALRIRISGDRVVFSLPKVTIVAERLKR